MKFVLASHNRKKLAEMQEILRELGVEVVLQSDVGLDLEPEETGTTFAENAAHQGHGRDAGQRPARHRRRLRPVRGRAERRTGHLFRPIRRRGQ